MVNILMLAASALLLHICLWYPVFFFWCSFIWLTPIFYLVLTKTQELSWRDGVVWGLIFYFLHLFPVVQLFVAQGHGVGRFIFPVLLIFYCALHVALWFWLAALTARVFRNGKTVRALAWLFWTTFFILWVPEGLLWISGQYIGYPLSFPLVPLAEYPQLLGLVPIFSRQVLVLCQVGCSFGLVLLFVKQIWQGFVVIACCLLPFVSGFWVQKPQKKLPDFFYRLGYVRPPEVLDDARSLDVAQDIYYRMRSVVEARPQVTCLLMPELSYRFALNEHPHIVALWNNNLLRDTITLIIGACRARDGKTYNSLYCIKNGCIQNCYDKSMLMPLAEYVPGWLKKIPFIKSIFLHDNEFCARSDDGMVFEVAQGFVVEPYICAEIFFGKTSVCSVEGNKNCVVSVLNDVVLSERIQHLMLLWSSFCALECCQVRLHVGYHNAFCITTDGNRHAIS